MKKVLVFGMTDNPGGVESVIMNYYRNIGDNIHFDFITNFEDMVYREEVENSGSKVVVVPKKSKHPIKHYKILKDFFKKHGKEYDAFWFNVCLLNNISYLKYAKKYGIKKIIVHAHNSKNMGGFIREIMHNHSKKVLDKYATDFWSCSSGASGFFYSKKITDKYDVLIINNAIDIEKYKFDKSIRDEYRKTLNIDNRYVIGNVGRLHFQKNQKFLIDVFHEIHKLNNNTCLVLVGDGEDKNELMEKVNSLKLNDSVMFLGRRNDVEKVIQTFDSFVFPSVFEGLSVVLFEIQATGVPVFASKEGIQLESKVNANFNFISLEESAFTWANKILNNIQEREKSALEAITKAGYNIKVESEKMIERF